MKEHEKLNELTEEARQLLNDKAFAESVEHSYNNLKRLSRRRIMQERRHRRMFEQRLYTRHRGALDLFDHFLATCHDLGDHINTTRGRIAELEGDSVFFVLARVHARACLTASEIRSLMFSGHASGALARWRALHELAVIATFIQRHGHDAAERYMWSEVVKTAKEAGNYNRHCKGLGLEPLEREIVRALEEDAAQMVRRFGKAFKEDWGWASEYLPNKPRKPSFAEIEESVGMQHWRPHVGMANHAVHGGFKGMTTDIGTGGNRYSDMMLSGPSMYGLVVPADAALQDFYKCTVTYLLHRPDETSHVQAATLTLHMVKARETFVALERRLLHEGPEND